MLTKAQRLTAETTKLSKDFTLYELIRSRTYPELVVFPSDGVIWHLTTFANNVLQPLRDRYGRLDVNSGYRNLALNTAVGGEEKSVHMIMHNGVFLGCAADIVPANLTAENMAEHIFKNLPVPLEMKCMILYRSKLVTRNPFIHVDTGVFRKGIQFLEKKRNNVYVQYRP